MAADILVLVGSARRDSVNRRLANNVATTMLRTRGAQATLLELADHPLPLYHGDLEAREGLPDDAR